MRFILPALSSLLLSSCLFQSSVQGENDLLDDLGIHNQMPKDSLDLANWQASSTASSIEHLNYFRGDSLRALVLGEDLLGGIPVQHANYFRLSVTDSTESLLSKGDTAYFALRVDSLSEPSTAQNFEVSWVLRSLDSLGANLSTAQKDTVNKIFFGADTIWHKDLAARDQNQTWGNSAQMSVQANAERWLKIPLPATLLDQMRSAKKYRQVLDLKITKEGSALPLTGMAKLADSGSTPRLMIGSAIRKINRFAEKINVLGAQSGRMVSNSPGDTLSLEFPIAPLREALSAKKAWQTFGGDSSSGPVVLGAQLSLQGFDSLTTLFGESVRTRVLYALDSSSYLNKSALFQESQYSPTALLKSGAQGEVKLGVGSAIAQALTQPSRVQSLKLKLVFSAEQKADSSLRTRRTLSLLKLKNSISAQLHLLYSPQNGFYTKELK